MRGVVEANDVDVFTAFEWGYRQLLLGVCFAERERHVDVYREKVATLSGSVSAGVRWVCRDGKLLAVVRNRIAALRLEAVARQVRTRWVNFQV